MTTTLEDVTKGLRDQILQGLYSPGSKLREATVSENLGVSRTLARLAMSSLEHEGLLTREPNRGSRVKVFTIKQIIDAIEVRGEIEAMAVRQVAERGIDDRTRQALEAQIALCEAMLRRGVDNEQDRSSWAASNQDYHDLLIEASGNWALRIAVDQISNLPLVSASAVIFERNDPGLRLEQLKAAHKDHREILHAIEGRQGHRGESLMREHAHMNARNKRTNLAQPETMALARKLPGGSLIAPPA